MIERGEIQADRMITHRFPYTRGPRRPTTSCGTPAQEALGVLLIWRE